MIKNVSKLPRPNWKDYELIDSGNGNKLERWGQYILIRPETVAIWKPKKKWSVWKSKAHAIFEYNHKKTGQWKKLKSMPNEWDINYLLGDKKLSFTIELTRFKHVGLFPEQAQNWDYMAQRLKGVQRPAVLNLFAYTGAASLAGAASGANVTHVDAIKQVITWANKNREKSKLENIRWIVDDALKFAKKEGTRGSKYDVVILDPPTWGLGPKGEKWKLEEKMDDLLMSVKEILKDNFTVIINTYSGLTPKMMSNLCEFYFPKTEINSSELMLYSKESFDIPTGTVVRIER